MPDETQEHIRSGHCAATCKHTATLTGPQLPLGIMANPVQLSFFDNPEDSDVNPQGIFVPSKEIAPPTPKPESNAISKRNKRQSWYVQTVFKKPKADGSPMA